MESSLRRPSNSDGSVNPAFLSSPANNMGLHWEPPVNGSHFSPATMENPQAALRDSFSSSFGVSRDIPVVSTAFSSASGPVHQPRIGESAVNLFPKTRFDRKRKISSPETFRPSKVLITEAALVENLDNLQLTGGVATSPEVTGGVASPPGAVGPPNSPLAGVVTADTNSMEPETWQNFCDSDCMDVDIEPAGRRVCPQLEMSESLKEAIRLIDRDESSILPENIASQIMPARSSCLALVPYMPPIRLLPPLKSLETNQSTAKNSTENENEAQMAEGSVSLTVDVPMEDF